MEKRVKKTFLLVSLGAGMGSPCGGEVDVGFGCGMGKNQPGGVGGVGWGLPVVLRCPRASQHMGLCERGFPLGS